MWVLICIWMPVSVQAQIVKFAAVGDVFFGRGGKEYGTETPFRYVQHLFKGNDIVLGNLETPICQTRHRLLRSPCSYRRKDCITETDERYRRLYYLTFHARTSAASILKNAGFTVMSTANNHMEDQGVQGIIETQQHLDAQQLSYVGTGKTKNEAWTPYIYEKNGVKIGIIAATTIWNFTSSNHTAFFAHATLDRLSQILAQRVARLKQKVDFVVVTLHYGAESIHYPVYSHRQLIEKIAKAGADVFVGTHPHVLQGIQVFNQMLVFWSLGNFLFDSSKPPWRESGIVHLDFVKKNSQHSLQNATFTPITLTGNPQFLPYPANPSRAKNIISKIKRYSRRFNNPKGTLRETDGVLHINVPHNKQTQ